MTTLIAPQMQETEELVLEMPAHVRAMVQMLDDAFGDAWSENEDPRFRAEVETFCVDVEAPVEEHDALLEKASAIEARMRNEFKKRFLIFVVDNRQQPEVRTA